jgi:hypothetical protein
LGFAAGLEVKRLQVRLPNVNTPLLNPY